MPLVIKAQKARLDAGLVDLEKKYHKDGGKSVVDFFTLLVKNGLAIKREQPLYKALAEGKPLPKPFDVFTGHITAALLVEFFEALRKVLSTTPVNRENNKKWADLKTDIDKVEMGWAFFTACGETLSNAAGAVGGALLPDPLWRKLKEPSKLTAADEAFLAKQGTVLTGSLDAASLKAKLADRTFPPATTNAFMAVYAEAAGHHFALIQADKKWTLYQSNHWHFLITEPDFGRKEIADLVKWLTAITAKGGTTKEFMQDMNSGLIHYVLIH